MGYTERRIGRQKGSSENKVTTLKGAFNRSVYTPVNLLREHKLQIKQAEAKLQSFECSTQQKLQLDGSWHHPWSRCLGASTPIGLQDRNTKWTFRPSNRARMGSQWTHDWQKRTKCKSGWGYPNLVGHRNLCFQNQRPQSIKEGTAGWEDAKEYDEVHRWAVRSGNAVEWTRANLPSNYSSALGQLYSVEQRFQRDPNSKNLYQQSIDTDVEKRFVKILDEFEVKRTFGKEWYLPHHPVLNPNKPGKVRRVCNAASKYKEVCLNDKLQAGTDLLHGLIETIFRYREGPRALTADIESMFLEVQVPKQDRSCLSFLWRPRKNKTVLIYECQRDVFGAKVLQLVQTMLSSEWDWTTKESIQLQQRQYKTTSTWPTSSNQ